jgi:hypothetical protein
VSTHQADPFVSRIRRAQAGIDTAERELRSARDNGSAREIGRLEREVANRRAYLSELLTMARTKAGI